MASDKTVNQKLIKVKTWFLNCLHILIIVCLGQNLP